jgi:hypothetical protein
VIVGKIDLRINKGYLDASVLVKPYSYLIGNTPKIRCYLNRVFDPEGKKIVQQIKKMTTLPLFIEDGGLYLDVDGPLQRFGIALGYYLELMAINFIKDEGKQITEIPVFPGEIKVQYVGHTPYEIEQIIDSEHASLQKIGEGYETIGFLYQSGFNEIAQDLSDGLIRLDRADFEGALKFFRKVVESWRNIVKNTEKTNANLSNRSEKIEKFLGSAYSMLSNFGEHAGTHGTSNESNLGMEISLSSSRYLLKYIREQEEEVGS